MKNDIKPIETRYKGYRFRSRLEARWAVFFDAIGIEWEYETEGYNLGSSGCYLPDFWLPQFSLWVEVKAQEFTVQEFRKCVSLSALTGFDTLMLVGVPSNRWYSIASFVHSYYTGAYVALSEVAVSDIYLEKRTLPERVWEETQRHPDEEELNDSGEVIGTVYNFATPDAAGVLTAATKRACNAARSARFEHGEVPQ